MLGRSEQQTELYLDTVKGVAQLLTPQCAKSKTEFPAVPGSRSCGLKRILMAKASAALGAPAGEDIAAGFGAHPFQETMLAATLGLFRLIGSFRHATNLTDLRLAVTAVIAS